MVPVRLTVTLFVRPCVRMTELVKGFDIKGFYWSLNWTTPTNTLRRTHDFLRALCLESVNISRSENDLNRHPEKLNTRNVFRVSIIVFEVG